MNQPDYIKEKRYSILLNSQDYIAICRPDITCKFVNDAYSTLCGKDKTDLLGLRFTDVFFDEQRMEYYNAILKMTPQHPVALGTYRAGTPATARWVHWSGSGVFDEHGTLIEIVFVGRDVTDSVELKIEKEKTLNTLLAFKRAIDTNIICTITNAKGIITYANEKFCAISKFSEEELIGKTHNIVNSGFHSREFFAEMWQTIVKGQAWTGQIKNKAKDGSFYWVESVIMPILDKNNVVRGYVSLRILISDRKRMEEERNTYLKSLEDMLFTVSHELRKPITSCHGLLMLLRENMPEDKNEYFTTVNYLLESVLDLESYSRKLNAIIEKNMTNSTHR